jgi:hypothetical protein
MKTTPYTRTARQRVRAQLRALCSNASPAYSLHLRENAAGWASVVTKEGSLWYTSCQFPSVLHAFVHIAQRGTNTGNDSQHFAQVARRFYRRHTSAIHSIVNA